MIRSELQSLSSHLNFFYYLSASVVHFSSSVVLRLQPSLSRNGAYLHRCEARWRPERTVRRDHQAIRAERLQAGGCQIHAGKHFFQGLQNKHNIKQRSKGKNPTSSQTTVVKVLHYKHLKSIISNMYFTV